MSSHQQLKPFNMSQCSPRALRKEKNTCNLAYMRPVTPYGEHKGISWCEKHRILTMNWWDTYEMKSVTGSAVSPSICHEVMEPDAIILREPDAMMLVFWMLSFKPIFSLSSFTVFTRLFSSLLSAIGWCHLHIWSYWYYSQQSWIQLHPAQHFSWCTLHIS